MGIPMEAAHRNYRDRSHKPEMLFPLTPFWALIGFRSLNDILERWKAIGPTAALVRFREKPDPENLRGFFLTLLTLPQARQEALISEALSSTARHRRFDPISAWVCRLQEDHPGQVGVLAPLFLNLVRLEPGQAVYLPPGELHAYLEGMALELSANSDNVLRGGLTPKHVDVPELLRVVTFTERQVQVLQPRALASGEIVYPAPAGEFRLSVISLEEDRPYEGEETRGVEILICTQGEARVIELSERKVTPLPRGTSVIVPAAAGRYVLEGRALLYKATVPL
jgi:mannose-6-phosphate isomerase